MVSYWVLWFLIHSSSLCARFGSKARAKFERYPSVYASAWIVREYKKRGGEYINKKEQKGTSRWFREQWIQVVPFLKTGKKIQCGAKTRDTTKTCRPLIRVTKETPMTIPELLKIHSKSKLISLANKKRKDMKGRLYWKSGKFISSKS